MYLRIWSGWQFESRRRSHGSSSPMRTSSCSSCWFQVRTNMAFPFSLQMLLAGESSMRRHYKKPAFFVMSAGITQMSVGCPPCHDWCRRDVRKCLHFVRDIPVIRENHGDVCHLTWGCQRFNVEMSGTSYTVSGMSQKTSQETSNCHVGKGIWFDCE
jgi:hypothetical protein